MMKISRPILMVSVFVFFSGLVQPATAEASEGWFSKLFQRKNRPCDATVQPTGPLGEGQLGQVDLRGRSSQDQGQELTQQQKDLDAQLYLQSPKTLGKTVQAVNLELEKYKSGLMAFLATPVSGVATNLDRLVAFSETSDQKKLESHCVGSPQGNLKAVCTFHERDRVDPVLIRHLQKLSIDDKVKLFNMSLNPAYNRTAAREGKFQTARWIYTRLLSGNSDSFTRREENSFDFMKSKDGSGKTPLERLTDEEGISAVQKRILNQRLMPKPTKPEPAEPESAQSEPLYKPNPLLKPNPSGK